MPETMWRHIVRNDAVMGGGRGPNPYAYTLFFYSLSNQPTNSLLNRLIYWLNMVSTT